MAGRRLLVLVAVVILGSGCGAAPPSSSPPAPSSAPPIASPTASAGRVLRLAGEHLQPCAIGDQAAQCGTLPVLEDRSDPESRQIDLRVAVLPATGPTVQPDPVFFLAGGPGGAATEDETWVGSVFATLHRDHDFVLVDQRGTGGSNRLVSPDPPDTTGLSPAQAEARVKAWVDDVLAALPGDARFYTTAVAMEDIDEVRAALGADRIDVIGASYGATAAQYYLRQHEDRVRSMVLDGATLLDVPVLERFAPNSQLALDQLLDRCDADAACHAAYPAVRDDLRRALAALRKQPVTTDVEHPWTGEPIVIDANTLAGVIHAGLLADATTARLPGLIHAAAGGDWTSVARAIADNLPPKDASTDRLVMSGMIFCSEAWARFDPTETARLAGNSYLGEAEIAAATNRAQTCRFVPQGVVPPGDGQPVRSDVPVLFTVGSADPQDPPGNIADAPVDLPASRTVIVPGQGHTVAHLGCVPSIVSAFIQAGTAEGLDTGCVADMTLPAFATP
jgi:pimeloyl-ACP methyl ester carboxylesterase